MVSILVIRSWQEIDPDGPPRFVARVRPVGTIVQKQLRRRVYTVTPVT